MTILSGEPNRTTFGTFHLNSGTLKTMLIVSLVIGAKEARTRTRGLIGAELRKGRVMRSTLRDFFGIRLDEVMTAKRRVSHLNVVFHLFL